MRGMIAAVLLAAGSARRFGSQKLLATLPDGRRVVEAAAQMLAPAVARVIAVTAADDELARVLRSCGCEVVVNHRAADGMGTSIAKGVEAAPTASGWLIALGDMPYIQRPTIVKVVQSSRGPGDIVIPTFQGHHGHPVLFGRAYLHELAGLAGDRGARRIVDRHPASVHLVSVADAGILADIDTPADLETPPPH
jgi:molybdenum cofactor cytidylyltransferase